MSDDHSWVKVDNGLDPRIYKCSACDTVRTVKILLSRVHGFLYRRDDEVNFSSIPPICSEEQVRSTLNE